MELFEIENMSSQQDNEQTPEEGETIDPMEKDIKKQRLAADIALFFIGFFSCLIIVLIGFFVFRYLTIRKYAAPVKESQTTETEVEEEIVLDNETINTLLSIQDIFNAESVYDLPVEDVRRGMIDGMVKGTGDKYAQFFTAEEFEELMQGYEGTFYGIGATLYIDTETGYGTINKVIEDSPAEKSGLQSLDVIVEVDGVSTYGYTLDELVAVVRGEKDTDVVLTIFREGEPDYLHVTVTRDEIALDTVSYELAEGDIGYIQITSFDEVTIKQFSNALAALKEQGMKGLVIDLRANGGGLLNAVCDMCRELLPAGSIVYREDAGGKREDEICDGSKEIDIPMVVLVNAYTASASEIMTGALQDYQKAVVMGTTTYGKGVVQGFRRLENGTVLKLTIERYFTPNGRMLDGVGIEPDIEVPFDYEAYYYDESHYDNQKDAAIQYLIDETK